MKRTSLIALILANFFDFAGLFMMVPIITPLIMDKRYHFITDSVGQGSRALIVATVIIHRCLTPDCG